MAIDLESIDKDVWQCFKNACEERDHDLRYLSLASLSKDQVPVTRLLVLRGVKMHERQLIFHTDIMSDKWGELTAHPKASILGFSESAGEQYRLKGSVELLAQNSDINQTEWDKLSVWTKNTYCGGPPGEEAEAPETDQSAIESQPPTSEQLTKGRARFGVIAFRAESLDWFQLKRSDNRRARFLYSQRGDIASANWINP